MSKEARVRVSDPSCDDSSSAPYSTRREKSRKLAQKRRDTYKQIMEDLTSVLPFPKEAVSQLDYNSRLRLALCFFRLKTMMDSNGADVSTTAADAPSPSPPPDSGKQIVKRKVEVDRKPVMFQVGALQDLMSEALDGFLMVTQVDGTIVFLSESIHKHMGLFQSEHIGVNMFELIHEEDHAEVRSKISDAEMKSLNEKGSAKVTFFCRMKCSRYKVANVITKSPGYKLVYISGTIKRAKGEPFIACVVRPVSPPSVLEIRLEGNMFVCRYGVDFTCTYFDGRLRPLLGYDKDDLLGKKPFDLFHHEDIAAIVKCRNKVFEKGESLSGYYRFFNSHGQSIWLQTRATLIIDSRTGKPVCVNCMFFVISKEDGDRDLQMRLAIQNGESNIKEENVHSHDPMPIIERADGTSVNPLEDEKVPSPDLSPLPPTSDRGESPTSSSPGDVHSASSAGNPSPSSSDGSVTDTLPLISSSGVGVSTSSLHSMSPVDSGTGIGMDQNSSLHGSSTSITSGNISSRDSVFTDRSSPQEPTSTVSPRAQSTSPDKGDSCLPDSTTSVHSSPLNHGAMSRTVSTDLGYRSGSSSSLREQLVSGNYNPIFRTESNASSILSDNPLSVCSSVHSNASGSTLPYAHTPAGMSLNPGFHSQSPFHRPDNGFDSGTMMPPPTATSHQQTSPMNQYNYAQQNAPIQGNGFPAQFVNGSAGVNVVPQVPMNLSNGIPQQQQFMPQNFLPSNGAPRMDLTNSLPDWTPGPSAAGPSTMMSSGTPLGYSSSAGCASNLPQRGAEQAFNLQTTAGPGFGQFVIAGSQMVPPGEVYNPPPIVPVGGASMFVNPSMAGHPSATTVMGNATAYNGGHTLASDLPQLTGEDLKILDTFDQFTYQQPAAVVNGSTVM